MINILELSLILASKGYIYNFVDSNKGEKFIYVSQPDGDNTIYGIFLLNNLDNNNCFYNLTTKSFFFLYNNSIYIDGYYNLDLDGVWSQFIAAAPDKETRFSAEGTVIYIGTYLNAAKKEMLCGKEYLTNYKKCPQCFQDQFAASYLDVINGTLQKTFIVEYRLNNYTKISRIILEQVSIIKKQHLFRLITDNGRIIFQKAGVNKTLVTIYDSTLYFNIYSDIKIRYPNMI